jgi:hypothetical protein
MRGVRLGLLLLTLGCNNNPTPSCNPPDGGSCVCSASDTVRNCSDSKGTPGLQFCDSGMWSACAPFVDGSSPD